MEHAIKHGVAHHILACEHFEGMNLSLGIVYVGTLSSRRTNSVTIEMTIVGVAAASIITMLTGKHEMQNRRSSPNFFKE